MRRTVYNRQLTADRKRNLACVGQGTLRPGFTDEKNKTGTACRAPTDELIKSDAEFEDALAGGFHGDSKRKSGGFV